jgi:hypothetical protein
MSMTNDADVRNFLRALSRPRDGLKLKFGIVTYVDVGASTITCRIDGGIMPGLRYLSAYAPVLGDFVLVLANGPDKVVLGTLA